MWQCEEDIIKDLAQLNDFGTPGDTEPYKMLYARGRGLRLKQKPKHPKKFLDPRTGDAIDIDADEISLGLNQTRSRGKGRGRMMDNIRKSDCELQKQLRLVKPMGSGDEVIETYFCRNRSRQGSQSDDTSTSDCSSDISDQTYTPGPKNIASDSSFPVQTGSRLKATRSSNSQSNALLFNLLNKTKENGDRIVNSLDKNNHCGDYSGSTKVKEKSASQTEGSHTKEFAVNRKNIKNNFPVKEVDAITENNDDCSFVISDDDISAIRYECRNDVGEKLRNFDNPTIKGNLYSGDSNKEKTAQNENNSGMQENNNEPYKRLGERMKDLRKISDKPFDDSIYDISRLVKHLSPVSKYNNAEVTVSGNPENFEFDEDDFPPLVQR